MKLSVDNDTNVALVTNPQTLSDVLLDVTGLLSGSGRVIQSIRLNGQDIVPEALTTALGSTPVDAVDTLEIESASMAGLVRDALLEMMEVLPELPAACHSLAEILQGETPSDGFGQFNQLMDIWAAVKERQAQAINAAGMDPGAMMVGDVTLSAHNEALTGLWTRSRALMESSDFAGLSDLLSYDLNEKAQAETEITQELLAKLS